MCRCFRRGRSRNFILLMLFAFAFWISYKKLSTYFDVNLATFLTANDAVPLNDFGLDAGTSPGRDISFSGIRITGAQTRLWKATLSNFAVAYALQGPRPTMEDRFRMLNDFNFNLFAVFDGHGGETSANYVEGTLFDSVVKKLKSDGSVSQVFNDEIIAADNSLQLIVSKNDLSGSTVLMAAVRNSKLTVANVGDSRAVLSCIDSTGRTHAVQVSIDHKPNLPNEKRRIEEAGGFIALLGVWRTAGVLAMSRAIGDFFLKSPRRLVIPDPDIYSYDIEAQFYHNGTSIKPRFLILATDGLWDTVSNAEAVEFIMLRLKSNKYSIDDLQSVAHALAELALKRGSLDNVTVVIVDLDRL